MTRLWTADEDVHRGGWHSQEKILAHGETKVMGAINNDKYGGTFRPQGQMKDTSKQMGVGGVEIRNTTGETVRK